MRFIKLLTVLFLLLMFFPFKLYAIENPLHRPNNKFGIHIIDPVDLEDAATLVNSSGGDWGYVTFVIRKEERVLPKWQRVFDKFSSLHLIPIVRIATNVNGGVWEKPKEGDIEDWILFLNRLPWPTQNRYVIIGNEPNHAKEWGGQVNPQEYAEYLRLFSISLKESSYDYFVLAAALDASAPNGVAFMDEVFFIKKMLEYDENIFDYIDAWNSHSYPNPEFSGSPNDQGRGSLKTYGWELGLLKILGVKRDFDVFITETGWAHNINGSILGYKSTQDMSDLFKKAFEEIWQDKKIVAITPFILSYPAEPFDVFSWKAKNGEYYDFYYQLQAISKVKGMPALAERQSVEYPNHKHLMCFEPMQTSLEIEKNVNLASFFDKI